MTFESFPRPNLFQESLMCFHSWSGHWFDRIRGRGEGRGRVGALLSLPLPQQSSTWETHAIFNDFQRTAASKRVKVQVMRLPGGFLPRNDSKLISSRSPINGVYFGWGLTVITKTKTEHKVSSTRYFIIATEPWCEECSNPFDIGVKVNKKRKLFNKDGKWAN